MDAGNEKLVAALSAVRLAIDDAYTRGRASSALSGVSAYSRFEDVPRGQPPGEYVRACIEVEVARMRRELGLPPR